MTIDALRDRAEPALGVVQTMLVTDDGYIAAHNALQLGAECQDVVFAQRGERILPGRVRRRFGWGWDRAEAVGGVEAEDETFEQGIAGQPVGAVHTGAGDLADRQQTRQPRRAVRGRVNAAHEV